MAIQKLDLNLLPKLREADIKGRKEILSRTLEGNWSTLFKGTGMEFSGYRQYTYADDASSIDWRASLRAKELLIKEYEEFKNFNVTFIVDTSNSMLFASDTNKLKCEYAAELAFSLSNVAFNAGDAVGLTIANDGLKTIREPQFGKGMRYYFAQDLQDKENYGGPFDFKKIMLEFNSMQVRDPSIVIIISDFIGLNPDWQKYLTLIAERNEVIGIMVRDKRDRELPKNAGQYRVKDPFTEETIYIDAGDYADEYKKFVQREEEIIVQTFKKLKSDCVRLITGMDYQDALVKFFRVRSQHVV